MPLSVVIGPRYISHINIRLAELLMELSSSDKCVILKHCTPKYPTLNMGWHMPRHPTLSLGFRQISATNHGTHKEIPTPTGIHTDIFQTPHKSGDRRRNPNWFPWDSHRHLKKKKKTLASQTSTLHHGGHTDVPSLTAGLTQIPKTHSWGSHRRSSLSNWARTAT